MPDDTARSPNPVAPGGRCKPLVSGCRAPPPRRPDARLPAAGDGRRPRPRNGRSRPLTRRRFQMRLLRRLKGYPGHPSHPPLTGISVGAYTIAAALLVLGALGLQEPAMAHGALLAISAGLILAPPTMLTGLLDWRDLPPRTPKRKLANLARSARKSAPWPDMSPFQLTGPQTPRRTGSADQWPMWLACRRRSPRRPRNHE